jgi:hypothetical protein
LVLNGPSNAICNCSSAARITSASAIEFGAFTLAQPKGQFTDVEVVDLATGRRYQMSVSPIFSPHWTKMPGAKAVLKGAFTLL